MEYFVDIVEGGQRREVALSGRAVVGATDADLVLPSSALSTAPITLEPRPEGCMVHVPPGDAAHVEVEGMRFQGGVLPWGTDLSVGGIRVHVRAPAKKAARRGSPVLLLSPIALGFALWLLLDDGNPRALPMAPSPPELFAAQASRCTAGRAPALHRAARDERAAEAKRERYPFAPADGIEALRLYQHAASCFADAGHGEDARRVEQRAVSLRERLALDYDTARFRLDRALREAQWARAREEVLALRALLGERPGDHYTEWLALLDRRLASMTLQP